MKSLLPVILITMLLSVINSPLFSQKDISIFTYTKTGNIIPNKRFTSPPDSNCTSLQFSTANTATTSIGSATYVIKTGRYNNWQDEAGDFDVIQFYKDNRHILTYKDYLGIVKLNDPENVYAHPFNQYSSNGYFIEVKISDTTEIVIFLGQHYGTDLSKLIIFAVTPNEVKLVYNQPSHINSIAKTNNSISMTVESNIPDEDEPTITHNIWSEGSVLKFKDN